MAIFVLNFEYAGLQSYQISEFLKMVKLCLKRPLVINGISMSRWIHCNPPKKNDPARLYKRISNLIYEDDQNPFQRLNEVIALISLDLDIGTLLFSSGL